MVDPIIDADLNAYVDGELDVARRIEVESYLSDHPEIAAKVMADLSIRGELRLSLASEPAQGRQQTREAARRLERGLSYGRVFGTIQRIAATRPPVFVEDAARAYRTTELREHAEPGASAAYNPDDIRAATGIVMPDLPKGWAVSDAQIYPSEFGPSVELAISGNGRSLSLFAVRPGSFSVDKVAHVALDGVQAAYWRIGEVAYVLIADGKSANLDTDAGQLARTLY
jgi:anti-sigma factor RsiW